MTKKKRSLWKKIGIGLGVLVFVALAAALLYRKELVRLSHVINLFNADVIVENFRSMDRVFDYHEVRRRGPVYEFPRKPMELPKTYTYRGRKGAVADWIDRTDTTGLVVIHDGSIVFENYYGGNDAASRCISWSVGKSFVSALIGMAFQEKKIDDLMDPVTKYVPSLKGSGYDGVPLKHVLQMSSGIGFNEDYGDFNSDINRMGRTFALATPMADFVASLNNQREPGTYHHYVSMDTQVLGMVLRQAVGQSLSAYLEEKIWSPLGMESDAYWIIDSKGMELAFGTLNVTLRDFARFGQFYLDQGKNFRGEQLLSPDWIRASVTPDAPHLQPGANNPGSDSVLGYGYQWWIPEVPDGDYSAIGVYGQFIYIHPKHGVVIAKTSAYADYNNTGDEMEFESLAVFRAIARYLDR